MTPSTRGHPPFPHTATGTGSGTGSDSGTRTGAVRLHEPTGFGRRRRTDHLLVRTPGAEQEQTARTARCAEEDTTKAARPRPAAHGRAEVTGVPAVSGLRVMVLTPRRRVRLHSRPHIDLQRVAGALCRP
ncbi:putative leader peptide [Streptomyces sp. NPDC088736]|uniref:putative leader peptide n=1 Tax=Streptomyces sp. NPDC088736 TaxID=3365881 RepID=UPI003815507F